MHQELKFMHQEKKTKTKHNSIQSTAKNNHQNIPVYEYTT